MQSCKEGILAVMALEFSAIPSTIYFGWVSDRIGGRRGLVATLCMLPIIGAFAGIVATPSGYLWLDYLMLMIIGCFIYPVLNLITICRTRFGIEEGDRCGRRIHWHVWVHRPRGAR